MKLSNWTPCERPGKRPLIGAQIVLEPLDWATHLAGLYSAVASPSIAAIWTYMPIGPFKGAEHFRTVFEQARSNFGWETLVIRKGNGGKVLGMASYMRIRAAHGSAEVGCVAFGPDLKRTLMATEAIYLMASHVFDELGYRRFEWKCHNENEASRRAAERFGFQFEGIFRKDMVIDGKNRDTAWFAMTDEEWPTLKGAYDAWLAPGNFDAAGQQKRTLKSFQT